MPRGLLVKRLSMPFGLQSPPNTTYHPHHERTLPLRKSWKCRDYKESSISPPVSRLVVSYNNFYGNSSNSPQSEGTRSESPEPEVLDLRINHHSRYVYSPSLHALLTNASTPLVVQSNKSLPASHHIPISVSEKASHLGLGIPKKRKSSSTSDSRKSSSSSSSGKRVKGSSLRKISSRLIDEHKSSPVSGTFILESDAELDDEDLSSSRSGIVRRTGDIDPSLNVVIESEEARSELAKIDNKIGDYVCCLCHCQFLDAFKLAAHRCPRIVHIEYRCTECEKVFNCPANLASHRRWHKPRDGSSGPPAKKKESNNKKEDVTPTKKRKVIDSETRLDSSTGTTTTTKLADLCSASPMN